jgi:hypothetical protein
LEPLKPAVLLYFPGSENFAHRKQVNRQNNGPPHRASFLLGRNKIAFHSAFNFENQYNCLNGACYYWGRPVSDFDARYEPLWGRQIMATLKNDASTV